MPASELRIGQCHLDREILGCQAAGDQYFLMGQAMPATRGSGLARLHAQIGCGWRGVGERLHPTPGVTWHVGEAARLRGQDLIVQPWFVGPRDSTRYRPFSRAHLRRPAHRRWRMRRRNLRFRLPHRSGRCAHRGCSEPHPAHPGRRASPARVAPIRAEHRLRPAGHRAAMCRRCVRRLSATASASLQYSRLRSATTRSRRRRVSRPASTGVARSASAMSARRSEMASSVPA